MTDKELLELAAKAAGIEGPYISYCGISIGTERDGHICWNPLKDDAAALRLAVKLHMSVLSNETASWVAVGMQQINRAEETHDGSDPYAATRRAIVRAAAEIGKEMK